MIIDFFHNLTYIKIMGYILFGYLSLRGIIFFFDEEKFNKVFLIAVMTTILGCFLNALISELIADSFFSGKYINVIFTVIFIIVSHIMAIKKDWKFSKHID